MDHAAVNRYAVSFVNVVEKQQKPLEVLVSLREVVHAIEQDASARHYFRNPAVLNRDKVRTMEKLVADLNLEPTLGRLFVILIENNRFDLMPYLPEAVKRELYDRLGMVQVDLTVPGGIDDTLRKRFIEAFEKRTGKQVVLNVRTDENIVGGAVAKIGSMLIDGSYKTNLAKIRQKLTGEI